MRATYGPAGRQRKNRILKRAKGFRGARSRLIRTATEATMRADAFAFAGRRQKKRHFRQLWIARLSAAAQNIPAISVRTAAGCRTTFVW